MKQLKHFLCLLLTLTLIITGLPVATLQAKTTSKTESQIKLQKSKVTLGIGDNSQITVLNAGKSAKISYKSKNSKIASVTKNGKVTALKVGSTKVYVAVKSNTSSKKLAYSVSVKKPSVSAKSVTITKGKTKTLSINNKPKNAKYKWSVKDKRIAKIAANGSKCKVTALKTGKTVLYAIVQVGKNTYKLSSSITVKEAQASKSFTVKFESNGGSAISDQKVASGKCASEPTAPSKSGYKFTGWFLDSECKLAYNFTTPVAKDITLYAGWKQESFSAGGGGGGSTNDSTPGGGSTNDSTSGGGSTNDSTPSVDQPAKSEYTVNFDINCQGMEAPQSQTIANGSTVTRPDDPVRAGYQFAGWFANKNERDWTKSYDFSTPVKSDMTLFAIWVDVTTDTDNDGLSDVLEDYAKTNKTKADTDDDGLTDYQEKVLLGTDPLKPDTDGDGVSDFNEDSDSDSLSNGKELEIGTNPTIADSDGDGLNDNVEVNTYSTSPVEKDTDSDGAEDGWEILNSFDPCVANASFDIVVRSEDVSEANPVSASVELNVSGNQTASLNVEPVSVYDNQLVSESIPGYLGKAYDFQVDGSFDSAELTFEYDESLGAIGDDFQPRVYYLNEQTGCLEELENQTVANGVVKATTTHFSTYILLNKVEFDKAWDEEIKPPMTDEGGNEATLDIALVLDCSDSMTYNDSKYSLKTISKNFISKLRDGKDKAAIVKFTDYATVLQELTNDKEELNSAIDSLYYNGMTNGSDGYKQALNILSGSDATYKYIIFLTDGEDTDVSYNYDDLLTESVQLGVTAYTIGMGDASSNILRKLADGTGGKYFHATTNSNAEDIKLDDVFENIGGETVDLTKDSNNDGIPDYYNDKIKNGTLRLSNGAASFIGYDFNYDKDGNPSDDYDGDGLKNGEELKLMSGYNSVILRMISDPTLVHSDGDCIDDKTEIMQGTNPLKMQISKSDTDNLLDDNKYMYSSTVNDYDNDWFWKADTRFLAVVFGVWNKDELYRDIYVDYFDKYYDTEYLEALQVEEERKAMIETLNAYLANIGKAIGDKTKVPTGLYGEITKIKDLISEVHGTKESSKIYYLLMHSYKEVMEEIISIDPELGKVSITSYRMRSDTITVVNLNAAASSVKGGFDKVSDGLSYIAYGTDVLDTIVEISKVNSNQRAFEQNLDILITLRDQSVDDHARDAANSIITSLSNAYVSSIANIIGDGAEIAINMIIDEVSKYNPYVLAFVVVRDGFDIVTGISDDIKQHYEMISYERLDEAIKSLLTQDLQGVGSYYEYDSNDKEKINRYLVNIAQVRILGEKKYAEWVKDEGLLGIWDDNSAVESAVNNKISQIKQLISSFGLKVSSKL